jgi:hypothetical protein
MRGTNNRFCGVNDAVPLTKPDFAWAWIRTKTKKVTGCTPQTFTVARSLD